MIRIQGNPKAADDKAIIQVGDKDIGKQSAHHYYFEENIKVEDLFVEILDLLEFYKEIELLC